MEQKPVRKFSISQSAIKDWNAQSPLKWYKQWITRETKRPHRAATTLGSVLDCIIFEPDTFEKRFIVAEAQKPSDKIVLILTELFETITDLNKRAEAMNNGTNPPPTPIPMKNYSISENKELVLGLAKKHDYYASKLEQAYTTIIKNGTDYFEFLTHTNGRTVVAKDELTLAEQLKEILLTDPISKGFFIPKAGCEVLFQVTLEGEYEIEGCETIEFLPLKGKLDIIHINHKRKEVREVDLKFTNDVYMFRDAIRRFDYVSQHSFYDYLIRSWLKTYRDGALQDYIVMNPLNVVIDDVDKIPYIYEYNPHDLYIKHMGLETPNRLVFKGWHHVLHEIAYHMNKQDWRRPAEHLKHGRISISIFNR